MVLRCKTNIDSYDVVEAQLSYGNKLSLGYLMSNSCSKKGS